MIMIKIQMCGLPILLTLLGTSSVSSIYADEITVDKKEDSQTEIG